MNDTERMDDIEREIAIFRRRERKLVIAMTVALSIALFAAVGGLITTLTEEHIRWVDASLITLMGLVVGVCLFFAIADLRGRLATRPKEGA